MKALLYGVVAMACADTAAAQGKVPEADTKGKWLTDAARDCEGFVPDYARRVIFKGGACRDGRIHGQVSVELMRMPLGKLHYTGFFVDGVHMGKNGRVDGRIIKTADEAYYVDLGDAGDAHFYSQVQPKVKNTSACNGQIIAATAKAVDKAAAERLARKATQVYHNLCRQDSKQAGRLDALTIRIVADDFLQQSPPTLLASATTRKVGNNWQIDTIALGEDTVTEPTLPVVKPEAEQAPAQQPPASASLLASVYMDRMLWNGHPTCRLNVRLRNEGTQTLEAVTMAASIHDNASNPLTSVSLNRAIPLAPKASMTVARLLPARLCEYAARVDIGAVQCTFDGVPYATCATAVSYTNNPARLGAQVADALPNIRVNF